MSHVNSHSDTKSLVAALVLAVLGLAMILAGNAFQCTFMNVDIDALIANVGALLLIVGILQLIVDQTVRKQLFAELRLEILGHRSVADSGIVEFHSNSKDVQFNEHFLTSKRVIIGVNYSAKLIDNTLDLLESRVAAGLTTIIVFVGPTSPGQAFLEADFDNPNIPAHVKKLKSIAVQYDPTRKLILLKSTTTILRYSFILFDGRAWIIVGTNGKGRRSVPGFMVRSPGKWFSHFEQDVDLLVEASVDHV